MNKTVDVLYDWAPEKMLEVTLEDPDDFLKVRETLTRIGIVGKKATEDGRQVLTQSCHLLHKKGRYYIVSFKEMFLLDGRDSNLSVGDIERRNRIASLLEEWGLLKIVDKNRVAMKAPMSAIRVVPFKEKDNFDLQTKYTIGTKK